MNGYRTVALIIAIIVLGNFFQLGPSIRQLAERLSDIPPFEDKGNNPALYTLAVHMMWIIALVGIVKLFTSRRRDGDE